MPDPTEADAGTPAPPAGTTDRPIPTRPHLPAPPWFPPLTPASFASYPATAAVVVAAIAASVAVWEGGVGFDPFLADWRVWDGQLWRLAAAALVHADVVHLAFNLYWLWVLGTRFEAAYGTKDAAGAYLLLAAGSSAAQYALDGPGVGLSGVGYGLVGLLWVLGRSDRRFAEVATPQVVGLFVVWFFLCWHLTRTGAWQVGNAAHAAGAVLGLLLGAAVVATGWLRVAGVAAIGVAVALAFAFGAVRPLPAGEAAYTGYVDLAAGRHDRAAARLRRAVQLSPGDASSWYNLGVAYHSLRRYGDARAAYEEAARLEPANASFQAAARAFR